MVGKRQLKYSLKLDIASIVSCSYVAARWRASRPTKSLFASRVGSRRNPTPSSASTRSATPERRRPAGSSSTTKTSKKFRTTFSRVSVRATNWSSYSGTRTSEISWRMSTPPGILPASSRLPWGSPSSSNSPTPASKLFTQVTNWTPF